MLNTQSSSIFSLYLQDLGILDKLVSSCILDPQQSVEGREKLLLVTNFLMQQQLHPLSMFHSPFCVLTVSVRCECVKERRGIILERLLLLSMQVNVLGCAMFHSFRLVSDEKGSLKNIINIHSLFQFCMQKIDNFHFIKLGLD